MWFCGQALWRPDPRTFCCHSQRAGVEARGLLTVLLHAQVDAALQSTVLAAVPVVLVDDTLSGSPARVHQVLPDATLEEALAALTAHRSIVAPWGQAGGPLQQVRTQRPRKSMRSNTQRQLLT